MTVMFKSCRRIYTCRIFRTMYNLVNFVPQNQIALRKHTFHAYNQSNKKERWKSGYFHYSIAIAVATAFCVYLYNMKQKFKISFNLCPKVLAIEAVNSNSRSRFNFVADVVEKCADAVVSIESQIMRYGKEIVIPRGTGFIIEDSGLILTAAHVITSRPQSFYVKLKDGRIFPAQIEYVDLKSDLATIRIREKNLPVIKLGTSNDLRAGEWVVAIGSPFSLTNSVCAGVVSSPQRKGEDLGLNIKDMHYIQTDANITFGNSGGPLVNLDGEVVGINAMKVVTGITFAIPVDYVKKFLKLCEEQRSLKKEPLYNSSKRRHVGVAMLTITPTIFQELNHRQHRMPDFLINKVLICEVAEHTPAYKSGLKPGDVIAEINGEEVDGVRGVYKAMEADTPLSLKIFRRDRFLDVIVVPELVY